MVHLTYIQNSGGRSGHSLGDILTVFILEELLKEFNPAIVFHASWLNQKIISPEAFKSACAEPLSSYDHALEISHKTFALPFVDGAGGDQSHWQGWSWEDFVRLKKRIVNLSPNENAILVTCSFGCKIHLHSVEGWCSQKHLKKNAYNRILSKLRDIYYIDHIRDTIRAITIHIRAGDLFWRYGNSLGLKYYEALISVLNSHLDYPIHIYCENVHSDTYLKLNKLKNTTLFQGGIEELERDINMLSRSAVLILSPCSLSLHCGYISEGLVLVDKTIIAQHRSNLFNGCEGAFEVFEN